MFYHVLRFALARYFHISFVQYFAIMNSKFIISLSQSANQINAGLRVFNIFVTANGRIFYLIDKMFK